jgi:NADPH:quinone reductase
LRALVLQQYGPPEALELLEVAQPSPAPSQVLVRTTAAAANYPDLLMMANTYQVSMKLPFVPGSEFAGTVEAIGPAVSRFAVGDTVFGTTMVGAFAEFVAVDEADLYPVPAGIDLISAAAFGVAYRTAYYSLVSTADMRAGETVLVLGAGGGVGLAAVDIAAVLGARVVAAASTAEKLAACSDRGASTMINYADADLRVALREEVPQGVDVVIDPVGGPFSEPALRAMNRGGRFVCVGFASGEIPRLPLNLVLLKGVTVAGFEFRTFAASNPRLMQRDTRGLLYLWAQGHFRPRVASTFPLSEGAKALDVLARRQATGKVLIDVTA